MATPKRCASAISASLMPALGNQAKGCWRPVNIHSGVARKLAALPHASVSTMLSSSRAPSASRRALSFSWAISHMLRQPISVTTGVPRSSRAASGEARKLVMGRDGERNQTWYARITRS